MRSLVDKNIFRFMMAILLFLSLGEIKEGHASYWQISSEAPYELESLVKSLDLNLLTTNEKAALKQNLTKIDHIMASLPTGTRNFLVKSTIYKWLLNERPYPKIPTDFLIVNLNSDLEQEKLSPFAKWLYISLKSDVIEFTDKGPYQVFLRDAKNSPSRNNLPTGLKRQIDLIRPWVYLFTQESAEGISLKLLKYELSIVNKVLSQLELYTKFNPIKEEVKTLTFFNFTPVEKASSNNHDDKVLNILDEIIKGHKAKNLPTPVNDWNIAREDEWTPKSKSSSDELDLLKGNSMEEVKRLPLPVDDWLE